VYRRRDGREHREYKRDKARRCSRSTRSLDASIAQHFSSIRRVAKALRSHPRGSQRCMPDINTPVINL
jgi:hypothetical protein